jgi:tripartite-type tricarboxylate transporter receptor subunit TctC
MRHQFQAAVLGLCVFGSSAMADTSLTCTEAFAGEKMTVVVPNSPGGGYDTYARALAPVLEKHGQVTARVVNMPAGGGRPARSLAMNADPDELIILLENVGDLVTTEMGDLGREAQAGKAYMIDGYDILGIAHVAVGAWLAQSGFDITDSDQGTIVAAEGGLEEALLGIIVAGASLGLETEIVSGYDGSGDQAAAVLRGEVDITSMSVTSAARIARDEGLSVVLTLSDASVPEAPDVPYLAGEGSLVWQLTEALDPAEMAERRTMAQAATDLKSSARGILISRNVPEARRDCVAAVIDAAMNDPEFIDAAVAQGRPVEPRNAVQSRAFVASMQSSLQSVKPMLDRILAERLGG